MKLLFLHLSDLHCIDKSSLSSSKIKGIKKAIKALYDANSFDEAFIFFTGDLSNSGQKEQFNIVEQFFMTICKYLLSFTNGNRVNLAIVPGNHDINFNNVEQTRKNIKFSLNENTNNFLTNYINKMDNFFEFAKKFNCFEKGNKLVDVIKTSKTDFNLKINLINTAPFSVYSKEINPDNDIGLHYISDKEINILTSDNNKYDLKITLMHHSPEFFDEESKNRLNKFLKHENGILLLGHEHIDKNITIEEDGKKSKRFTGGPLSDNHGISEFQCLVYDTSIHEIIISNHYFWNKEQNIYESNQNTDRVLIESIPKIYKKKFMTNLTHDSLLTDVKDFREIFVFPDLKYKDDDNSSKKISSFEELNKTMKNSEVCIIEGDNNIGKTTLAKYLFLESTKKYRPLLFNTDNINNVKISKIIKQVFDEEYDNMEYSFSKYEQEDTNLRIAIIDDVDKIQGDNLQQFLSTLKKFFRHIILIKNTNTEYDLITLAKNMDFEKEKVISLEIKDMYYTKRQLLLKNICSHFFSSYNNNYIKNKAENINKIIAKQSTFFQLKPGFIILCVKSILNDDTIEAGKVFNSVFEKNITNTIQMDSSLDVSVVRILLQKIAYFIHTNRKYPISQNDVINIIEQYNEESGGYRVKVNATDFLTKLVKIRLLCYTSNNFKIKFCYDSYLSYFIAKEVLKQMDKNIVNDLFSNICYGINSDILLFMCYLDENKQKTIIDFILSKANDFFSNYNKELNLSNINIPYLKSIKSEIKLNYPTKKEKEKSAASHNKIEEEASSKRIAINNLYDYESSDIKGEKAIFISGIKYIKLISRLLPDFIHLLDKIECERIVNAIYEYPNKFLYMLFNNANEQIQELFKNNNIFTFYEYNTSEIKTIVNKIQRLSMLSILSLYDMVARYAGANNTLQALDKFNYKNNISYYLINALVYDSLGQTNELGSKLTQIYDSSDDVIIKNICRLIFYYHCVDNYVNIYGDNQRYIGKFISNKASKSQIINFRGGVKQK